MPESQRTPKKSKPEKKYFIITMMLHQEQRRLHSLKTTYMNVATHLRNRIQAINSLENKPDSTFRSFVLRTFLSCTSSDNLMNNNLQQYITNTEKTITMFEEMIAILER